MAEYTTLSVRKGTRDDFNEAKERFNEETDSGSPDLNTDEFIRMLLETLEHGQDGGYSDGDNSESITPDELAREVSRSLDYAELATKVADEVEGRLR